MKRKRRKAVPEEIAAKEKPQQTQTGWKVRFIGADPERTQDLLGLHDGGRAGFRMPLQG